MTVLSKIGQVQAAQDSVAIGRMRQTWIDSVSRLAQDVQSWVGKQSNWALLTIPDKEITEEPFGTYTVPVVRIITPAGTAVLEPIARNVRGSDGRVDLYAFPTLNRVRLLFHEADCSWVVRTDSGLDWPQSWSEATFVGLVNGLTGG